jgi:hypothetical protein
LPRDFAAFIFEKKTIMNEETLNKKALVETMIVHAKIDALFELQAEILSQLNKSTAEEEKLKIREVVAHRLHEKSQDVLKLDFLPG